MSNNNQKKNNKPFSKSRLNRDNNSCSVVNNSPGPSTSIDNSLQVLQGWTDDGSNHTHNQESITALQTTQTFQPIFYPNLLNGTIYHNYQQQFVPSQMLAWPGYSHFNAENLFGMNFRSMQPDGTSHNSSRQHTSNNQVSQFRSWQNMSTNINGQEGLKILVMSYNVLAQDLVTLHPYLYSSHNQESLHWQIRWNNLLKEIKKFSPDILCLQEVQESHLEEYYSVLNKLGYGNIFKKRTGNRTDGCAIYYKSKKFNLVEYTHVEYYQDNIFILNRDNVAIIAKFAPKNKPSAEFIVATTHLLYNPRRQDIRLAQIQLLLTELDRIAYKSGSKKSSCYTPVIVTGDLNSRPDSPILKFLKYGKLKYEHLSPKELTQTAGIQTGKTLLPSNLRITDKCVHAELLHIRKNNQTLSRSEELDIILSKKSETNNIALEHKKMFESGTIKHNFPLKSVYKHKANNGGNEGTTFQNQWVTVDYIFYSGSKVDDVFKEDKLKLLARYRLPTEDELNGITIPNSSLGSDHLSLLAKFFLQY